MKDSISCSKRDGKRKLDEGDDDDDDRRRSPKQRKTPAFSRDEDIDLLRSNGCLLGVFPEQLREELLKTNIPGSLAGRSSPPLIQESGERKLQLRFTTKMPDRLFAGQVVKGEGGSKIHVALTDSRDGSVVQTGPESTAKLSVLALLGDFDEDFNVGWTPETFKRHQVKERVGKGPILDGDIKVTLKDGVGILGSFSFTDNSSFTRTKTFRLGVELAPGSCQGICVMEAKTEAFAVLDQRGETNKKHYPPALQDEVFRLTGIAKDKPLHKILLNAGIIIVEDLLRFHAKDPQKLRTMLGSSTTGKKWMITMEHAKTCDLSGGKCYVFFTDESQSSGIIFNHIHELQGLITNGEVLPLESHDRTKEVSYLVKKAYENWHKVIEHDDHVLQSFTTNKEIEACQEEEACSLNDNITYTPPINHQYSAPEPILQIQSEPILQFQPENMYEGPRFEFPLFGSSRSGETSGAGCSCSLEDCLDLDNEQGLKNLLAEMMEELPFIDPETCFVTGSMNEVGETSVAGCSYSSEDLLLTNNSPTWEYLVDGDMMENAGLNIGGDEMELAAIFRHSNEAHYSHGKEPEPEPEPEPFEVDPSEAENGMIRARATIGWHKIKAALRWGILMRKKAAERRAQLTELD